MNELIHLLKQLAECQSKYSRKFERLAYEFDQEVNKIKAKIDLAFNKGE